MSQFMIRTSALGEENFYIDFNGEYEVYKIASCTGINENIIDDTYNIYSGKYSKEKNVYYFNKRGNAVEVVEVLTDKLKRSMVTRTVDLTENEIEYIRKALINEDSNIIFTNNGVRTSIFNKLNQ